MRELPPVIEWTRNAQGELLDIGPQIKNVLGWTRAEVLTMEQRRHTMAPLSADGFEAVFEAEMEREGETSARMFKADLQHRNGAVVPAIILMIFVREDNRISGFHGYGCPLPGWQELPMCCQNTLDAFASSVADEHRKFVLDPVI